MNCIEEYTQALFQDGFAARRDGLELEDNPHWPGSPDAEIWSGGWHEAARRPPMRSDQGADHA